MVGLPIDNDFTIIATTAVVILSLLSARDYFGRRAPSMFEQRLIWDTIVERRHGEPSSFVRHIRMRRESFDKLLDLVRDKLEADHNQAARRGGIIMPEICLYCTLRWLGGG